MGMGFVFAFDGADGCGKTMISQLVVEELRMIYKPRGFELVHSRMPGGTNLGINVRQILKNRHITITPLAERLLFAADTAEHFHSILSHFRDFGLSMHVVDRWSPVTDYMYGIPRGVDVKTLTDIRKTYMNKSLVIMPDILFLVDVEKKTMLERLSAEGRPACRIEKLGNKFHEEVWEMYRTAMEPKSLAWKHCQAMAHNVVRLDNTDPSKRTLRDVADDALATIKRHIEERIENTRGE